MKTGIILLMMALAASAPAQSTGGQKTNAPAASVPTNKPPAAPSADIAAKSTAPGNESRPQAAPVNKAQPVATDTNTPTAYPDTQIAPDTSWETLQGFERSLGPRATSRRKVDATDKNGETGRVHGVSLDGVVIKATTMSNPLQLINPFAPPEYGWGTDTLVPAVSTHSDGIAFFSLRF